MAISRLHTWSAAEVLLASDLNGEFNNILNNGTDLVSPFTKSVSMGGFTLNFDAANTIALTSTTNGISLTGGTLREPTEDTITAHAGGGQTNAFALSAVKKYHRITTCATAADSVKLPTATPGQAHYIRNDGASAMQVFGSGTDTIDGVATATGVSQWSGCGVWHVCTTAGNWLRDLAPSVIGAVSVKDRGAVGDGVADDTAVIQAALDAHSHVLIPDGSYLIDSAAGLKLNDNQVLTISPGATILRGSVDAGNATIQNVDIVNGNSNITIVGGTLNIVSDAKIGRQIKMNKVTGFRLFDTRFLGVSGTWNTYLQIRNAIIRGLYFNSGDQGGEDGIHVVGGDHIIISDCNITCGDDCVALVVASETVWDIHDVVIDNITCAPVSGNLLSITVAADGTANTIKRVTARNIVGTAPSSSGDPKPSITVHDVLKNNQISDINIAGVSIDASGMGASTECVQINYVNRIRISDLTVDRPYQRGLVVNGCDDVRADRVTVISPRTAGVVGATRVIGTPTASTNIHFSKFKVVGSQALGLDFTSVTTGSIKDCLVTNSASIGIQVNNSTYIEVSGNNSSSNTTYGFVETGSSDNNNIHDNQLLSNGTAPASLSGTSTRLTNNFGYLTENHGAAATISDGGTISHGLAVTPTDVQAVGSVASQFVSVTAIGATTFTVAIKKDTGVAGDAQTIYWRAKKY